MHHVIQLFVPQRHICVWYIGEICVGIYICSSLSLSLFITWQRGKRKRTVRGRGDEKSQPAADQKNTQSLEEAVNEAVAQMATVLHL